MVARTDPFLGLGYGDPKGTDNWHVWMDENLVSLGANIHVSVESATTTTPAAVVNGQRWLIPVGATGAWSTHIGELACAVESSYRYVLPKENMRVVVKDTGSLYIYFNSAWSDEDDYGTL
jgi:hypothetical protein